MTLLEGIAQLEGYNVVGSRPRRNNNPGDIEWGEFARAHGATRVEWLPEGEPRFAFFPDPETGYKAMSALLQEDYKGLTLREMVYKWAPPDENNSEGYLKALCSMTGIAENTVIDEYVAYVA